MWPPPRGRVNLTVMRFLTSLRLLAIIGFAAFAVVGFQFAAAQSKGAIISGYVRDQRGKPIERAHIRILSKDTLVAETYSDSAGKYELSGLAGGKLAITMQSLGFVTKRLRLKLTDGQTKQLS